MKFAEDISIKWRFAGVLLYQSIIDVLPSESMDSGASPAGPGTKGWQHSLTELQGAYLPDEWIAKSTARLRGARPVKRHLDFSRERFFFAGAAPRTRDGRVRPGEQRRDVRQSDVRYVQGED